MVETYTNITQFDFQITRFTSELRKKYPSVKEDLKTIHIVQDTEKWYLWWSQKAKRYQEQGILEVAAFYYRAALFYLPFSDPRKEEMYLHFTDCFYRFHQKKD